MTNLETYPFTRHQGLPLPPPQLPAPNGLVRRGRAAMRRYFYYSGGVAFAALSIAMFVSILALNYTSSTGMPGVSLAEAASEREPPVYFQFASVLPPYQREVPEALAEPAEPLEAAPAAAASFAAAPPRAPVPLASSGVRANGVITQVNITFYDCLNDGFCGAMYNGEKVYEGAAACSWNLPIGTAFYIIGDPTGRVYICKDRGLLDDTWVDIFWNNPVDGYYWQSHVGRYGTIVLVSLPE
jgi:hypothetical protein